MKREHDQRAATFFAVAFTAGLCFGIWQANVFAGMFLFGALAALGLALENTK